ASKKTTLSRRTHLKTRLLKSKRTKRNHKIRRKVPRAIPSRAPRKRAISACLISWNRPPPSSSTAPKNRRSRECVCVPLWRTSDASRRSSVPLALVGSFRRHLREFSFGSQFADGSRCTARGRGAKLRGEVDRHLRRWRARAPEPPTHLAREGSSPRALGRKPAPSDDAKLLLRQRDQLSGYLGRHPDRKRQVGDRARNLPSGWQHPPG